MYDQRGGTPGILGALARRGGVSGPGVESGILKMSILWDTHWDLAPEGRKWKHLGLRSGHIGGVEVELMFISSERSASPLCKPCGKQRGLNKAHFGPAAFPGCQDSRVRLMLRQGICQGRWLGS